MAIHDFLSYWKLSGKSNLDKLFLQTYITHMQDVGRGEAVINLRLSAIRKLAREAVELQIWPETVATAFTSVKNIPQRGKRTGNWLSLEQSQQLICAPDISTLLGLRNRAILATLLGCGVRGQELTMLNLRQLQLREDRWVFINIIGKRNKSRSVTVPSWLKKAIDTYSEAAGIQSGRIFQAMTTNGKILHEHISHRTVYDVVKMYARQCGFDLSPHDLRRTYAKLALKFGARIEQIQLSLGHQSLATTQIYLGTELDLKNGPGDFFDINLKEHNK
jgi:site-specific recombinase XerD